AVLISASPRPRDLHSFPTRRSSDLLTLLFRFMTPLIEAGHVYLARPPLYKIKWDQRGGDADYVFSDRERDEAIARGMAAGKKDPRPRDLVQRFKGLGERNAAELWDTTMDPDRRVLLQVTLDDAAQADEMFSVLMGEDVGARPSFIQRNGRAVRFLDICPRGRRRQRRTHRKGSTSSDGCEYPGCPGGRRPARRTGRHPGRDAAQLPRLRDVGHRRPGA